MITLNTQQYLHKDFLILSRYFTFFYLIIFFLLSFFKLSCTKKHHVCNLYRISYTLSLCYVMYYIVSEICIGGSFLEDCFFAIPNNLYLL